MKIKSTVKTQKNLMFRLLKSESIWDINITPQANVFFECTANTVSKELLINSHFDYPKIKHIFILHVVNTLVKINYNVIKLINDALPARKNFFVCLC